jgi:hypothetical protein
LEDFLSSPGRRFIKESRFSRRKLNLLKVKRAARSQISCRRRKEVLHLYRGRGHCRQEYLGATLSTISESEPIVFFSSLAGRIPEFLVAQKGKMEKKQRELIIFINL